MSPITMRRGLPLAAAALALGAAPAAAHVTAQPAEAPAGGYQLVDFIVPHGCDGAPTTSVAVQIPEGIYVVKPMPKPGWELETERESIEPVDIGHGQTATERTSVVRWSGGSLDDTHVDRFTMQVRLPEETGTLYFPVVQGCGEQEHPWIEIPADGESSDDLESPAPPVDVVDAGGDGHDAAAEAPADGEERLAASAAGEHAAAEDHQSRANLALGVGGAGALLGLAGIGLALRRRGA